MAKNLKHVGKLKNSQRRVIVVFREIPEDEDFCLVVDTDALPDWMHDDMINAVESPGAQASANFYEYAQRSIFTDGSNMLQTLHNSRRLSRQPTNNVIMTPNSSVKIGLDELNTIIREQNGGAPAVNKPEDELELATKTLDKGSRAAKPAANVVVDDGAIAQNMLAQAETFAQEAERLREQAYSLDPSLKPKRGKKVAPKKAVVTE
jgi:hypothetical protein